MTAKTLYLVRHAKASGQSIDAPLTEIGHAQSAALATLMADLPIDRILTSPYLRAQQTAQPLADRLNLPVEQDNRFGERVLSPTPRSDWFDRLRDSFDDYELCLSGGESNRAVQARGVAGLQDALTHTAQTTVVVNHGTIMTLMLNHFTGTFGFEEWGNLTNPDLYRVEVNQAEVNQVEVVEDGESTYVTRVDGIDGVTTVT